MLKDKMYNLIEKYGTIKFVVGYSLGFSILINALRMFTNFWFEIDNSPYKIVISLVLYSIVGIWIAMSIVRQKKLE